jgi:hypothetical protein
VGIKKAGVEMATAQPPPAALARAAPSTFSWTIKDGSQYLTEEEVNSNAIEGVRYGGKIGIWTWRMPQSYPQRISPNPSVATESSDHLPVIFAPTGAAMMTAQGDLGTGAGLGGSGGTGGR